jgi:ribA/ribD-fused uncharacterized protein
MIVHFKDITNAYLSNFYIVDVEYLDVVYPSSEHAYMSAKSDEIVVIDEQEILWKEFCKRRDVRPSKVKGQSRYLTLPENWNEIKIDVMYNVLVNKFKNESLRKRLLSTGNQNIQEGNWHSDVFWGVDLKSTPNVGENHLGRLLMRVRDEIRRGDY